MGSWLGDAVSGVLGLGNPENTFKSTPPVNKFNATAPTNTFRANAVNPATSDYANAIRRAQAQANGQNAVGSNVTPQQQSLADALRARAAGTGGPSVAATQLAQTTAANQQAAAAAMASNRGVNPALAARLVSQNAAATQQNAAGQGALLRAQEQTTAEQNLGNVLAQEQAGQVAGAQAGTQLLGTAGQLQLGQGNQAIQQNLGLAGINAQTAAENQRSQLAAQALNQATAAQNASLELGSQQINAGVSGQNATIDTSLLGGGIQAGASALGMLSDKRLKKDIVRLDEDAVPGVPKAVFEYKGTNQPMEGVIAQDVEKKYPDLVRTGPDGIKRVHPALAPHPVPSYAAAIREHFGLGGGVPSYGTGDSGLGSAFGNALEDVSGTTFMGWLKDPGHLLSKPKSSGGGSTSPSVSGAGDAAEAGVAGSAGAEAGGAAAEGGAGAMAGSAGAGDLISSAPMLAALAHSGGVIKRNGYADALRKHYDMGGVSRIDIPYIAIPQYGSANDASLGAGIAEGTKQGIENYKKNKKPSIPDSSESFPNSPDVSSQPVGSPTVSPWEGASPLVTTEAPYAAHGGEINMRGGGGVPGTPKHPRRNLVSNDTVPAVLTPQEIVLPLSVTQAEDAPDKAKKFVQAIKNSGPDGYGKVLAKKREIAKRRAQLEAMSAR